MLLFFNINSFATTSYEIKNNYPKGDCTVGQYYDDGEFIYKCNAHKKICATYCLVFSEDDGAWMALEENERITYDQEAALRCELGSGKQPLLAQALENVTIDVIAESKVPFCR